MNAQKSLRILFLLTQSLESPTGGGRHWPLAKALAGRGHDVTIIALHHNYASAGKRHYIQSGVNVRYVAQMHVLKTGDGKKYYGNLMLIWLSMLATIRLTWAALRTPCDVIHVGKTQPMNGLAAWITRLFKKVPVFLDSDDYESVNNRFSSRWQQKVVSLFEDWMPSFADGITTGTTFLSKHFESLGYPSDRIILVHNGVDRERFEALDDDGLEETLVDLRKKLMLDSNNRKTVIFVGSISLTSHAIDVLLDAFLLVREMEPEALLILVGTGEDMPKLKRLVGEMDLDEHVRFLGRVNREDVPLYYRLGEVSVDPMHRSLPAESSLSLKLVESIVAGVPCVTADIGDRRQVIDGAGLAVQPDNPEALSNGILQIFENDDLQQEMIINSRRLREELFWDHQVVKFASIYDLMDRS